MRQVGSATGQAFGSGRRLIMFACASGLISLAVGYLAVAQGSRTAAAGAFSIMLAAAAAGRVISIESLLLAWFIASPVANFFLRIPAESSIVTFDRVIFTCILVGLAVRFQSSDSVSRPRLSLNRFEITWGLLSALALASAVIASGNPGYALRLAVDAFFLPLIAFHVAREYVNSRDQLKRWLTASMALALGLFMSGFYELMTGNNLLNYPGTQLIRDGEIRVNGPFISDSSFAIVSLLLMIFLIAAPEIMQVNLDRTARIIRRFAISAALAASLMPLFRAVAAALFAGLLGLILVRGRARRAASEQDVTRRQIRGPWRRGLPVFLPALLISGLMLLLVPGVGDRLTSSHNILGRLATWEEAVNMAAEAPAFGIGLANYHDRFHEKFRGSLWTQREAIGDARAADSPHSNPLWIAAELGFVGLFLYLAATAFLIVAATRSLRWSRDSSETFAAGCFLVLMIVYWLPGLTLTSGQYSELNIYFFTLLGLLMGRFARVADRLGSN